MVDMGVKRRHGTSEGTRLWQCECRWRGVNFMVVVVLLAMLDVGWAQSLDDAVAYLNNVEDEVMRVAATATENFVRTCGTITELLIFSGVELVTVVDLFSILHSEVLMF